MQPLSGNQRPDLLTSLMNMSLVLRLPREMHLCRSSSNVPRSPSFLDMLQNPHVLLTFDKVHNPLCVPRVVRACGVFNMLTSKCASRHNGVHFFDISERAVLLAFSLANVLRATMACTLSTSQLPKVLRTRQFFTLLTLKCASRHNTLQFFISHLASWLRTRRFSEPTFRPSRATTHWKNRVFRDFPAFFLRTWIFFLLRLSLF